MKIVKWVLRALGVVFLAVVILIAAVFADAFFGSDMEKSDDISYYQALSGEIDGPDMIKVFASDFDVPCPYDLPLLSEMETVLDYRFDYTAKRASIFQSHAYVLIVSYDSEEYVLQNQQLDENYVFRTELIEGETDGLDPCFQLDGFDFRCVSCDDSYNTYPKSMFFVGTSDVQYEIAYIYFYNQDLDFVSPSLAKFIEKETGWNEVKE